MHEKASTNAYLVVNLSESQRVELRCKKGEVLIGRSPACDLILPESSVSRKHARIVGTEFGFFIEDVSKNGTFIDGRRITKETLADNTEIKIGPYVLNFMTSSLDTEKQDERPTAPLNDTASIPHGRKANKILRAAAIDPSEIGLIGNSKEILELFALMKKVAETDFPVLIIGETGTGKELVARGIHLMSTRRAHSFVAVNCSAIAPGLTESELFGHEKGAFTGALSERKGAFEIAQGGTLFLDEVGDMSKDVQPKLLRALEESEIKRVGGTHSVSVNIRIIAATNRDLREETAEKMFRKDLFYRLNSFPISIPPLRERSQDVKLLADYFLLSYAQKYGKRKAFTDEALDVLAKYPWPGNVRELKNVINRAAVLTQEDEISSYTIKELLSVESHSIQSPGDPPVPRATFRKIDLAERETIVKELNRTKWNKTRAAKNLGIAKSTLFEKLRRYSIKTPDMW